MSIEGAMGCVKEWYYTALVEICALASVVDFNPAQIACG